MKQVEVVLYDRLKDKEVTYRYEVEDKYADNQDYSWFEGNYACDDNRGNFVARELGEEDPDYPCGDDKVELRSLIVDGRYLGKDENASPPNQSKEDK